MSHSVLINTIKKFIPPLTNALHKGQAGRIAVIGGSEEIKGVTLILSYTGAPFFASISALKLGADLCHVFCEKHAGLVIKCYSPELMVHPYLRNTQSLEADPNDKAAVDTEINKVVDRVAGMFPRLHVLVVGPGLSRDEIMIRTTTKIIEKAKENRMPLVIDADGLFVVQNNPDLIKGYPLAVLTPNVNEFARLCDAVNVPYDKEHKKNAAQKLSEALGNVTVLQKGGNDIISNGKEVVICDAKGSPRRCGGQGDLLSGTCATFLAWGKNYEAKAWNHPFHADLDNDFQIRLPLLAAWGAALLTRSCSRAGFAKKGRAMTTSDMIEEIGGVFQSLFEPDQKKAAL